MGDPKKHRKQYERPRKPWDRGRLEKERKLKKTYGLKNKREIYRVETLLRYKRKNARNVLALPLEKRVKRERELMDSLRYLGILREANVSLDDVLAMNIEQYLERRLQTVVWRKNLARTIDQARQFIVHGHIGIKGKRVSTPSYLVRPDEEGGVSYYGEPMQVEPPKPEKKADMKKAFEEAAGEGTVGGEEGGGRPAAGTVEKPAEAVEPETKAGEVVEVTA